MDTSSFYKALSARDARFDGVFFVGVTTTGVYCRPICPARTPGEDRCRYFLCSAAAESEGFRACFRCRPELAPGAAPMDASHRLARVAVQRIEAGALDQQSVEELANELGISGRQLRRVLQDEVGSSPLDLANHRRLLLSRHLLSASNLSISQIAFASGFQSIRRFNDAFSRRFGRAPSSMRRAHPATGNEELACFSVSIPFRPPYAWKELLGFLRGRAIPHVEHVDESSYSRTLRIGDHIGWLRVEAPRKAALPVTISATLLPQLLQVLGRLRSLFDTDAHPSLIAEHLANDELLGSLVRDLPGLRVPGTVDGFEMSCRAILGQQISVKAATTLSGRLATLGPPIEGAPEPLARLFPTPHELASQRVTILTELGITEARARALILLANAMADGGLVLSPGASETAARQSLESIRGVGPWTSSYIALRALRWPDAFPAGDAVLKLITKTQSTRQLEEMSSRWSPWRSYAALYLWQLATRAKEGIAQ
ncbi:MAG: AlkA N-terminal domain-containing protein [Polyangiaceae bacterium]